jgi:hypothetical protein
VSEFVPSGYLSIREAHPTCLRLDGLASVPPALARRARPFWGRQCSFSGQVLTAAKAFLAAHHGMGMYLRGAALCQSIMMTTNKNFTKTSPC